MAFIPSGYKSPVQAQKPLFQPPGLGGQAESCLPVLCVTHLRRFPSVLVLFALKTTSGNVVP